MSRANFLQALSRNPPKVTTNDDSSTEDFFRESKQLMERITGRKWEEPVRTEPKYKPLARRDDCVTAQFGELHQAFLAAHEDKYPDPPLVVVEEPENDNSAKDIFAEGKALMEALHRREEKRRAAEIEAGTYIGSDELDLDDDIEDVDEKRYGWSGKCMGELLSQGPVVSRVAIRFS